LHCFCESLGCEDLPTSVTSYMIKACRSWICVHLSCQSAGLGDFNREIAKSLVLGVSMRFSASAWVVFLWTFGTPLARLIWGLSGVRLRMPVSVFRTRPCAFFGQTRGRFSDTLVAVFRTHLWPFSVHDRVRFSDTIVPAFRFKKLSPAIFFGPPSNT